MVKLLLVGLWPIAAITTLTITIFIFMQFPFHAGPSVKGVSTAQSDQQNRYNLFTAIPSNNTVEQNLEIKDARVEIIRQFLKNYDSELVPYANLLVETAEKYHLDFRLLPAVAMQESTVCKKIPAGSHNCWGWGIYGDTITRFDSYEEAIETVAQGLSDKYIFDGLSTPEMIMSRYTPSSNGSWAEAVRHFMEEME